MAADRPGAVDANPHASLPCPIAPSLASGQALRQPSLLAEICFRYRLPLIPSWQQSHRPEGNSCYRTGYAIWLRRGVSVIAITGLLCGCAPGAFTTQSQRIGPDDGTDSCRTQLVALDSTGNFFGAQILQGAAVGAGVGALAGGLIGGLATGNWRGAAIGALAGGITGGVIGGSNAYWNALQQQQMDQAALYSRVSLDLERENAQIDKTQLAFDQLEDCRFRQAQAINADYAGAPDRPDHSRGGDGGWCASTRPRTSRSPS